MGNWHSSISVFSLSLSLAPLVSPSLGLFFQRACQWQMCLFLSSSSSYLIKPSFCNFPNSLVGFVSRFCMFSSLDYICIEVQREGVSGNEFRFDWTIDGVALQCALSRLSHARCNHRAALCCGLSAIFFNFTIFASVISPALSREVYTCPFEYVYMPENNVQSRASRGTKRYIQVSEVLLGNYTPSYIPGEISARRQANYPVSLRHQ